VISIVVATVVALVPFARETGTIAQIASSGSGLKVAGSIRIRIPLEYLGHLANIASSAFGGVGNTRAQIRMGERHKKSPSNEIDVGGADNPIRQSPDAKDLIPLVMIIKRVPTVFAELAVGFETGTMTALDVTPSVSGMYVWELTFVSIRPQNRRDSTNNPTGAFSGIPAEIPTRKSIHKSGPHLKPNGFAFKNASSLRTSRAIRHVDTDHIWSLHQLKRSTN